MQARSLSKSSARIADRFHLLWDPHPFPCACWRAVFPARVDEPEERAMSDIAVNERLQGLHPNPRGYNVVHRNIYNVHQRVAARFRANRVFLAGDSSHL